MKKLTLLSDTAILLDGLPVGPLVEFLQAHPELVLDYIAALRAFVAEEYTTELTTVRAQLARTVADHEQQVTALQAAKAPKTDELAAMTAAAEQHRAEALAKADALAAALARERTLAQKLAALEGKYEPRPYYQIHALPAPLDPKLHPQWAEVTHVGVRRAPEIGGHWLVDLLRELPRGEYARVTSGVEIPADAKITSYTEIAAANFEPDLTAWVTVQNTPRPPDSKTP